MVLGLGALRRLFADCCQCAPYAGLSMTSMTRVERPKRRANQAGEESRRRVLDAAEELFAEKGFDRTSFVDIERRSGVSRGSIPWHFQNKDGVLMAVLERVIERYVTIDAPEPERFTMRDLVAELRTLTRSGPPGLLHMIVTAALSSEGSIRDQYVGFFRSTRKRLAVWLPMKASQPMSPSRARDLAVLLNAALFGIQLQWAVDPEEVDLDRSLDLLADVIEAYLAVAPASTRRGGRVSP